jgi:autotransporter-associated beta strand protein
MPIRLDGFQTFSTPANTSLFLGSIDTNGRTLTVSGGGRWDLNGTITGSGGLIFNGPGLSQVTSASPNTFSGSTVINSGSVQLVAAHPNSHLQMTGGDFFGGAAVKSIAAGGGVIHPQSVGALSSTGNVNLGSAVVFNTSIKRDAGSATSATFVVGGEVNLGNSTLTLNSNFQVAPTNGDAFKIIDKTGAGPIQGIFKVLPEAATLLIKGYPFRISYAGGDGNDVVLTLLPPILFVEEGTANRALALDSVTFLRSPFRILTDHNFSADHHTRLVLLTSNLGLTQPDPSVLTVQASEFGLEVESVGTLTAAANGLDCSYIVVRLPDFLPPGEYQITFTLRGLQSNAGVLSISP